MRPFHRRWTAKGLGPMLAAAVMATGIVANPAGAALPTGVISKVSPEGDSTDAALDDAGATVAYLQGVAGHVMVGGNRIVPGAGAKEVAISGDGNRVAFSTDRRLVAEDTNDFRDVYVVNRDGGGLRMVSTGLPGGYGSFSPSLSGEGNFVAFSAGLVAAGTQGPREIWLRDLGAGGPVKLPVPAGERCDCLRPSISNDANAVAFEAASGVMVWDRGPNASSKIAAIGASRPSISGNGRVVAFQFQNTVNVFDRDSRALQTAPEDGSNPALSADGNVMGFQASNPLQGGKDTNNKQDVVAWAWRASGANLARVSAKPDDTTAAGGSFRPSLSADGGVVAFESDAGDLVGGDGNNASDIFLRVPGPNQPGPNGGGPVDIADIPGSYWLVASDGGVFSFAGLGQQARFFGSTGNIHLNQPIVGMSVHPGGEGYWFVASDGGVFNFGASQFFGSTGNIHLNKPIVGMASTPSGNGYWLVASDGGIFNFGDAKFLGSTGNIHLNKPIVGMASTPSGNGYWLVATDGGIFAFGDAAFMGSTGDIRLNKPIVGMAARPQGDGYWLVATDGGIFAFGRAPFMGSTGAIRLNQPIVGMANTGTGSGYWLVASDGGVFNYGDAGQFGSMGDKRLNRPIVGMAGHN